MQYVRLVHFSNDQINKKTVQKMTNDDKLCVENNISADFFFCFLRVRRSHRQVICRFPASST